MPVFAEEILHGGSHTFGFLMGASGLGALSAALYLAAKKSVAGLERIIPLAAGTFGMGLVIFSFSGFIWLSLILMVLAGLGMMLHMAASNTILQTIVEDDKRGRVMSFYTMAFMGTAPFGSLISGSLANIIGTRYTILAGGVCCILGGMFFMRKLPEIKKEIHPLYTRLGIIPDELSEGIHAAS
jgi:MFS family permease